MYEKYAILGSSFTHVHYTLFRLAFIKLNVDENVHVFQVDFAFAFRCALWPIEATEWITRKRSGIDQLTVNDIASRGCYLTHKPCGIVLIVSAPPLCHCSLVCVFHVSYWRAKKLSVKQLSLIIMRYVQVTFRPWLCTRTMENCNFSLHHHYIK